MKISVFGREVEGAHGAGTFLLFGSEGGFMPSLGAVEEPVGSRQTGQGFLTLGIGNARGWSDVGAFMAADTAAHLAWAQVHPGKLIAHHLTVSIQDLEVQ